jgi:thermolysin
MRRARCVCLLVLAGVAPDARAAGLGPGTAVAASSPVEADAWGSRIEAMAGAGELTVARVQADPDFPGSRHVRYDQRVGAVRVFGKQLVRQIDERGRTLSVFGRFVEGIALDVDPRLSEDQAARDAEQQIGGGSHVVGDVELVVLPLEGRNVLAYMLRVFARSGIYRCFVDAQAGGLAYKYNDLQTEAVTGSGTGVWSDRKKMSVDRVGSGFRADDRLRPAPLVTYDLKGNFGSFQGFLQFGTLDPGDVAADSDNDWTNGAVVDAHAYAGYTYDYYFKVHNRQGLDGADIPLTSVTNVGDPRNNAGYFGNGYMVYLDGDGFTFNNFAGALDVVAHELTHGVTEFSWNGIYERESGALNEAFSDIMGASVESYFEPAGTARGRADWFLGEDLTFQFDPPRNALRSMENPSIFCHGFLGCDPDNYRRLFNPPSCNDANDNCGVHINSGIANQAFYLLVQGGTNRTSGLAVAGLGFANRERAERIFYRGFTAYLTPSARFADARRATIRAAQELFGDGSAEAAQTAAAWTAVGVN